MQLSVISAAVVAAVVGIAGALAVVLEAARAVGASPAETTSWVAGLCLSMALTSGLLSAWHRIPVITAWSTPGAAVIAATAGAVSMPAAVGAFLVAGALIVLTAAVRPLGRLIERIPIPIAAAMLAGVLLRFVVGVFEQARAVPELVLPLIAVFLVARLWLPAAAMLLVMAAGAGGAAALGLFGTLPWPLVLAEPVLVRPAFDPAVIVGLALPLYLVTMASQNLPGAAVLRAAGYSVPFASVLAVTGLASIAIAPFGAHTINLAAITAAICTGPDAHPDPARRWTTGVAYLVVYGLIAAYAASLVALFAAFPPVLIKAIAGLGLMGALAGALGQALAVDAHRFAAVLTFAVTASGVTMLGVGSAFWGLVAGLVAVALERARAAA